MSFSTMEYQEILDLINFPEDTPDDVLQRMSTNTNITPSLSPSSGPGSFFSSPASLSPITPPSLSYPFRHSSEVGLCSLPSNSATANSGHIHDGPVNSPLDMTTYLHSYLDTISEGWPPSVPSNSKTSLSSLASLHTNVPYNSNPPIQTICPSVVMKSSPISTKPSKSSKKHRVSKTISPARSGRSDSGMQELSQVGPSPPRSRTPVQQIVENRVGEKERVTRCDKACHKVRPTKGQIPNKKAKHPQIKHTPSPSTSRKKRTPSPESSNLTTTSPLSPPKPTPTAITPLMNDNLPEHTRAILALPYRCYEVARPDYVAIANDVLLTGTIMLDARSRRKKYRCRHQRDDTPTCDQRSKLMVGPDMLRHMGIHADQERILVDSGRMAFEDAKLLQIFKRNPALYETIDPKYCTCHACDPPEVFQRKDSYQRHFKSRHNGTSEQLREIAAAIRGMSQHRQFRFEERG